MEKEDFGCINAIYNTPDLKKTYVGTYGNGLFIIDNQTNEITHCMANNSGLQTNNIYSIVPDKNGNLFLGTENGLSFYNQKEQTFTNWTREQGLQGANFNPTAGIHTRNGQLIFGSNEGVIILPDSLELPSSFSSHMVFSNLNIMYHPVHPMEKNSPLTKNSGRDQFHPIEIRPEHVLHGCVFHQFRQSVEHSVQLETGRVL